jgi:hypothetical protein
MPDDSLKNQAQEIMAAVNKELQTAQAGSPAAPDHMDDQANVLMKTLFSMVSNVDLQAAEERVQALRAEHPEATTEEIVQKLIRHKCQRTAAVGAATSGAALIPGLGTAAAMTFGVAADIGATFKLQSELVLEIAAAYNYPLSEEEKQRVVMVITGLSAGTITVARRVGEAAAIRIGEKYAEKAIMKALPVIGVIGSAGTNVLSTYIIGQRADAYFRLGPEAVGSWADSLRAITGLDEHKIGTWLAKGSHATGAVITVGAHTVGSGAKAAGRTAQKGIRAYFNWQISLWGSVFRTLWQGITFIPRKLRGSGKPETEERQTPIQDHHDE